MKIWNQDETVKFRPSDVIGWEISLPGSDRVIKGNIVKLEKYMLSGRLETGFFCAGLYDNKEDAKNRADQIDGYADGNEQQEETDYIAAGLAHEQANL